MSLGPETASTALKALEKLKRREALEPADEFAVERLWSFLSRVQLDVLHAADEPDTLDDTQRAYLLSFRDRSDSGRRQYLVKPPSQATTPRAACESSSSSSSCRGPGGGPAAAPGGGGGQGEGLGRSSTEDEELAAQPELEEQLRHIEDWEGFDVFRVAQLSEGYPLRTVTLHLLRRRGLIARLCLPEAKLKNFLDEAEHLYPANPYHNSTHAADVTQALGAMLAADALHRQLSDLELLSVILAAAVHDLGHPGVSNDFLINTNSEAALQYNDRAINENMHLATAFRLLTKPDNNFLSHLPEDDFRCLRSIVINIVLGTDMARHHNMVQEFAAELRLFGPQLSHWPVEKRTLALQMLVHSADISNPARPWSVSQEWGQRVQDEFFAQGDRELDLGLRVSPQCNRQRASVAQNQSAFIEYVMRPSFEVLAELAPNFAAVARPHIDTSLRTWREMQQQQAQAQAGRQQQQQPQADQQQENQPQAQAGHQKQQESAGGGAGGLTAQPGSSSGMGGGR